MSQLDHAQSTPSGVIFRDTYEQPGAPDPVLDPSTVLELARRHAPGARAVEAVDETGGEARTYMIAADAGPLVVKTQRPHRRRTRTSLQKEALFLRHLASLPGEPLRVPRVLGYGRHAVPASAPGATPADVEIEFIVMTRIPGDAVQRAPVEGSARSEALGQLGAVLRRIHDAPQETIRASGLFPGDSAPGDLALRLETPALDAMRRLASRPEAALLGSPPEVLVRRAVAALPAESPRVALHANPSAVHTFVDLATGAFTGLIDFGDAYISHPALDLRRWDSPEDRAALLAGHERTGPVGPDFLRVWRLACALADLALLASSPATPVPTAAQRAARITSLLEELTQ